MEPGRPLAFAAAECILLLHLLWCLWILLGCVVTRGRPTLRILHIVSIFYAIVVELLPWPVCPLTLAENWFETRAGAPPNQGPFLVRLLERMVYPNLPNWVVVGGAVLACQLILLVYLRRYSKRNTVGAW